MNITIIGCNGYLGKHLSMYFTQKGSAVYGYDIHDKPSACVTKYTCIDITCNSDISRIDADSDFVFFFSGLSGINNAYDEYAKYIDVNEKGLLNILDMLRRSKSRSRIIYPSTRLVYKGMNRSPLKENSEKEFKSIYALNKWFGEQVIQQYNKYFGINFTIYRICVPYGNWFGDAYSYGTIGIFLNQIQSNGMLTVFGEGEQMRTFTSVDDLCHQVFASLMDIQSLNQIFNIGGETMSLIEIAEIMSKKFGVEIKKVPWPKKYEDFESGDTIFDATKIFNITGNSLVLTFRDWITSFR